MVLRVYRLFTSALYWLISPYGDARAKEDEFWRGRLGRIESSKSGSVWIHAASAGEVRIASYLANYLLKSRPSISLVGTVQTRTGFEVAQKLYPESMTVAAFPLDATRSVRRALERVKPSVIVIAETEIWFNFLSEAFRLKIPVVLVNGRMTEKAFGRYRLIRKTISLLLGQYQQMFLKTDEDSKRYGFFDVSATCREVSGDMKFDAPVRPRSQGRAAELRARMGVAESEFLLVAGSTRSGEEEILFELFKSIRKQHSHFRLVIAPRHIDRAEAIVDLAKSLGLPLDIYGKPGSSTNCILVDKFGVLEELYMAADLAFVGGTLVDIGGHNLLEPVWGGTPALFGPSLSNVLEAADYIVKNNFGAKVNSAEELTTMVADVISGKNPFSEKGDAPLTNSPTVRAGDYILELSDVG